MYTHPTSSCFVGARTFPVSSLLKMCLEQVEARLKIVEDATTIMGHASGVATGGRVADSCTSSRSSGHARTSLINAVVARLLNHSKFRRRGYVAGNSHKYHCDAAMHAHGHWLFRPTHAPRPDSTLSEFSPNVDGAQDDHLRLTNV